uniref:AIG1-type G domain-containing protein n=1 Tax=Periophthalmus magnuspinnatus TaxID=409849 RepID=A0A3B4AP79_9GOBI
MDTVDKLTQGGSLRIALIGKRSRAIANTILGVKHFPLIQPKAICEKVSRMVHGRTVTMLITPPLYNDSFSDEQLSKCVSELSPGPHVYLLLLPIGNIDKQDKDSLQLIKKRLREKVADYVFIVFTNGELLEEDYTIENYIEECDDSVKDILNECKSRYHVLNNKTETNRTQVAELLDKIDKMTQENSCNYFTKEMLKMKELNNKQHEQRSPFSASDQKYTKAQRSEVTQVRCTKNASGTFF